MKQQLGAPEAFLLLSCLGIWRKNHFRLIEISTLHSAANHGPDDHLGFIDINTSPEDLSHSHRSFHDTPVAELLDNPGITVVII
jgi:hypothetical protein